jgi:Sec-independent protein translocase protein TatA
MFGENGTEELLVIFAIVVVLFFGLGLDETW